MTAYKVVIKNLKALDCIELVSHSIACRIKKEQLLDVIEMMGVNVLLTENGFKWMNDFYFKAIHS